MTAGRFDAADHARRMRAAGWWRDTPYDACLVQAVEWTPDRLALVAWRARPGHWGGRRRRSRGGVVREPSERRASGPQR